MAIFDKFQKLAVVREELERHHGRFLNIVMEDIRSATEAVIDGKPVILAGTNNYLGLTFNDACIQASCQAVKKEGTGTTGSRMANGTLSGHVALEQELSDFLDRKKTIVFSTGYVANLAILSTLVGPGEVILLDGDCHASIYDGCKLGGAEVIRFRHNNPADLEKRLQRLAERKTNILIVVEGIYSMMGDRAPLAEIVVLKKKYGVNLIVDEAHSLGVLGENGRGLAEEAKVEEDVDFVIGTFSKSLGAIGGFCSSNHPELDLVRYASRPYVFTASSASSAIASTRAALQVIRSQPELRTQLWDNARNLHRRLQDLGYKVGSEPSPIIAIRYDNIDEAYAIWNGLLERSIYVNMVLPPATPDGGVLLRCSLSAAHSPQQVEKIADAFASLSKNQD
ncbi:serine palmitoyltransferase [Desulfopila aestuarii]|uniref:Serine palmitoyltransferase n=1 Tax=Desulfopila aestuarii DSM 18488 TaxID=1121416 RepID=A0A1M7YGT0_9BACT|nr:aminotransferase class I/II-fold pyridoxal phosphate-dependent enzyme [Desulfopila aestuarii]SHO51854.1 serine palmitoyltransferase [Desulfopila aestuarii DSM 18488]